MDIDDDQLRDEVYAEQLSDVLDTVADRAFPTRERRDAARQTAALSVTAYQPRDPVETTLAGHCVIYDNLLRNVARDVLRGLADNQKPRALSGILGCGRMFLSTLNALRDMQGRGADQASFAHPMPVRNDTVAADVAASPGLMTPPPAPEPAAHAPRHATPAQPTHSAAGLEDAAPEDQMSRDETGLAAETASTPPRVAPAPATANRRAGAEAGADVNRQAGPAAVPSMDMLAGIMARAGATMPKGTPMTASDEAHAGPPSRPDPSSDDVAEEALATEMA